MSCIIGIDSSTKSVAMAVLDGDKMVECIKVVIDSTDLPTACAKASEAVQGLLELHDIEHGCIEAAPYINNASVMKSLSMVQGAIVSTLVSNGVDTFDVPPVTWQKYIGNPPSNKSLRAKMRKRYPKESKTARKRLLREHRKQVTLDWAKQEYGLNLTDDDMGDACGVAHWAKGEVSE